MRVPWLSDVLTDVGLRVATPVGNPIGRGRDMHTVYGVVAHDTVTPGWDDLRVAELLRDGRPAVPGPLSQLGVRPDGTVDWIADGRCNHNGYGRIWGNNAIAFEVYCGGGYDRANPDPWNAAQRESVVIGARAILDHLDLGPSEFFNPRVAGHRETDPDRKIDPYGVDMDQVRRDVAGRQLQEVPAVATKRIAGEDRYQTAARICRTRFDPGDTGTVYIMLDGSPDGQVAPLLGAPILLVEQDRVPGSTAAALRHFRPDEVVALGGPAVVPDAILQRCAEIAAERR